jgi:hypothetical protein
MKHHYYWVWRLKEDSNWEKYFSMVSNSSIALDYMKVRVFELNDLTKGNNYQLRDELDKIIYP